MVADVTRRGFITAAASALAACAVTPSGALLGESDRAKLERLLSTDGATVVGHRFVLSDGQPVSLGSVRDLTVRSCEFTWIGKSPKFLLRVDNARNCKLMNCSFDASRCHTSGGHVTAFAYFGG